MLKLFKKKKKHDPERDYIKSTIKGRSESRGLRNIFRTITGVILLSCRNTPNQKVNFSSICRSELAPLDGTRVFCLAVAPHSVLAAFPWSVHGEPGSHTQ